MNSNVFKIFLLSFSLFILSCDNIFKPEKTYPPDNHEKVSITQGVWGNVWFWEGNFMPTTDNSSDGTITPVERKIYIYEATRLDSVIINADFGAVFYDSIATKQIAQVESDKSGFYQIELPPGKYSVFVKEDSLFYGSEGDSEGYLMLAQVYTNSVTKRQIDIDYKAAY